MLDGSSPSYSPDEKEKTSSIDKVFGPLSEQDKQDILDEFRERFERRRDRNTGEDEKTPEELAMISFINTETNKLRQQFGYKEFDIPPGNVFFHDMDDSRAFDPNSQFLAIPAGLSSLHMAKALYHEMLHFKSGGRLRAKGPMDFQQMGIGLRTTLSNGQVVFNFLNEAVTEIQTQKFINEQINTNNPLFKEEAEWLKKDAEKLDVPVETLVENLYGSKSQERAITNLLINKLEEASQGEFSREQIINMMIKGMLEGSTLQLGLLVDHKFGNGTFRKIAEMVQETGTISPIPNSVEVMDFIKNLQLVETDLSKPSSEILDPETPARKVEITPEIEEIILEKLQDIDQDGTAYTSLESGAQDIQTENEDHGLEDILQNGILNREWYYARLGKKSTANGLVDLEPSEKMDTEQKRGVVYFFIVGRTDIPRQDDSKTEIAQGKYSQNSFATIVFDLGRFSEIDKEQFPNPFWAGGTLPPNTYTYNGSLQSLRSGGKSENGRYLANMNDGFALADAIPANSFKGIIVRESSDETINRIMDIQKKAHQEQPENMLPIYNINGDLLWPRKIAYKEVQQLVGEKA